MVLCKSSIGMMTKIKEKEKREEKRKLSTPIMKFLKIPLKLKIYF